ncbi:MAG: hypothetical protein V1661_00810 [bacterium]
MEPQKEILENIKSVKYDVANINDKVDKILDINDKVDKILDILWPIKWIFIIFCLSGFLLLIRDLWGWLSQ